MKKMITLMIVIVGVTVCNAQPLEFEKVFRVDSNLTQNELYSRAKAWFANEYNKANEVIQVDDKERGEIIGAPVYSHSYKAGGVPIEMSIKYRISVKVKQGRYKTNIYGFFSSKAVQGSSRGNQIIADGFGEVTQEHKKNKNYLNENRYNEMTASIRNYVNDIFDSLNTEMSKPTSKDSDW